ncbi:TPA: hypothetical protein OUA98_005907, partial [Klebsiella michiganensis]|nr:hypothetical protein [Klebsiella michiganensis]
KEHRKAAMDSGPVAYADPQAFENVEAGSARREWMWKNPDADLVPLYRHAQPAPVLPDGYVMVPKEPTEDMIAAAMNCDDVRFNSDESFCVQFWNIYEAMLAAAPQEVPDGK